MSFKIVVDSCCDLTPQMRKDPCFVKVPLSIHANGSVFVDDDTMDQADLLWSMRQSEDAPSTACPSPQAYLDAYQGEEGEDVYVVTLSALLSGSPVSSLSSESSFLSSLEDRSSFSYRSGRRR